MPPNKQNVFAITKVHYCNKNAFNDLYTKINIEIDFKFNNVFNYVVLKW